MACGSSMGERDLGAHPGQGTRCGMVDETYAGLHRTGTMGTRTENPIMNPTQAKRFGSYIRRARLRAELSQARLAKLVGADNTRIMRLEAGITLNPAADFLSDIAEVLGLDLFEVFEKAGYAETSD